MWQDEVPTEAGFWWLCGARWQGDAPDLYVVEVWQRNHGFVFKSKGVQFAAERAVGKWRPVDLPELPAA